MTLRLRFYGVRGSTPAPGRDFVEVGGHTSCVAVLRGDEEVPRLVLDAGTGLQALSASIDHHPFAGTIALTHLHWDHVQGLPFFRAGDQAGACVRLLMPAQGDPLAILSEVMTPPHFPIDPTRLAGSWTFGAIDRGPHDLEGFVVTAEDIPHKGGRTFGYRIEADGCSAAYLPDHRPARSGADADAARRLCAGVDVLVHDAQCLDDEVDLAVSYGHATVGEAIDLAVACGARHLVLFHHAPGRSDAALATLERDLATAPMPVTIAREGANIAADRHGAVASACPHRTDRLR